ncbi:MAG: AraC family transcriptional regulator [Bacteroidota bacterium]
MTFYQEQIKRISREIYPKDYLCQQVTKAKLFIDKNFANNITLDDIAGEAFFSKFHFIRLFKTMYGRTPHQYLASVRIRKAKQYLQKGMPVTQACLSVGFTSLSSFNKLFKKSTGFLPSSYKKKMRP